jgi:hypothetical protein
MPASFQRGLIITKYKLLLIINMKKNFIASAKFLTLGEFSFWDILYFTNHTTTQKIILLVFSFSILYGKYATK